MPVAWPMGREQRRRGERGGGRERKGGCEREEGGRDGERETGRRIEREGGMEEEEEGKGECHTPSALDWTLTFERIFGISV